MLILYKVQTLQKLKKRSCVICNFVQADEITQNSEIQNSVFEMWGVMANEAGKLTFGALGVSKKSSKKDINHTFLDE